MIYKGRKEIAARYIGSRVIAAVYYGVKLVWEAISSCFGSGAGTARSRGAAKTLGAAASNTTELLIQTIINYGKGNIT